MARNAAGGRSSVAELHPQVKYNKLDLARKRVCYNFWIWLETKGSIGWNPNENPGSLYLWRSSELFLTKIKQGSWRKLGIDMAQLAKVLKEKGIKLKDPLKEYKGETSDGGSESEPEVSFDLPADSGKEQKQPSEADSVKSSEESFDEMPASILKTKKSPPSPSSMLEAELEKMSLKGRKDVSTGNLPMPIVSGRWTEWDHDTEHEKIFVLLRVYLHPTSNVSDLQLKWINPKLFQIRLKWPVFMQWSVMTAGLDPQFPQTHKVYEAMGKAAKELREDDGQIWSTGHFKFKKPMEPHYQDKLFDTVVDAQGNKGMILQIVFEEVTERDKKPAAFTSPQAAKGPIKFSSKSLSPSVGRRQQQRGRSPAYGLHARRSNSSAGKKRSQSLPESRTKRSKSSSNSTVRSNES